MRRATSGQIGKFDFQHGYRSANRHALINHLILLNDYQSYLEIGVRRKNDHFNRMRISDKVGVDPDPNAGTATDFDGMDSGTFSITVEMFKF